ncbi:MAG TPA: FHA domain-containing protein [Vicinamibacteria bacterium]|nr:FHA domain-containing protein [Vicinamibacteria bacterium]
MIIVCPTCQARYKFDESKLGERPKAKTRCAKCGSTIEIENPLLAAMTLPPGTRPPQAPAPTPPAPAPEPAPGTDTARRATTPSSTEALAGETITGKDLHKMGVLELPKDKRYSLAVIQGAGTGQIHQINKTRTIIGRTGADLNLDDAEASRQHAAVEILGENAILRDLGSTNGTFIELDRIQQHVLNNHMEFRIGSHVLMFIVTDVE